MRKVHLCSIDEHREQGILGVACGEKISNTVYDGFTFSIPQVTCNKCLESKEVQSYFVKRLQGRTE